MSTLRRAGLADVPALAALLELYMRETFRCPWGGDATRLGRDLGARVDALLASPGDGPPIGFAAWVPSYDVHHCVPGATLLDMFVAREHRARGVAAELVARVAAEVRAGGGVYIAGMDVGGERARRLYDRVAVAFPGRDCIVGGRAFRELADLAGRSAREIARNLPPAAHNHEP
jgi:GNAT superfamily N-acetyltransferase